MALSKRKQPEPTPARRRTGDRPPTANRPQAFSYHASRSQRDNGTTTRSAPVVERPKQLSTIKTVHVLYIVAAILIILAALFQTTTPRIQIVGNEASRQLLQAPLVYQQAASDILSKSAANHFKPLTDDKQFESEMTRQFPELAAVSISPAFVGTQPIVVIEAVQPAFIITGNGGSFVVDANGTVRLAATQLADSTKAQLPAVIDQSGLILSAGRAALPASDTAFILQVLAQLKAAGLGWDQITLPVRASEVDVKIANQSYYVKFALRGGADARQQAGTFLAIKDQVGNATYVDVRVPERAYYK